MQGMSSTNTIPQPIAVGVEGRGAGGREEGGPLFSDCSVQDVHAL